MMDLSDGTKHILQSMLAVSTLAFEHLSAAEFRRLTEPAGPATGDGLQAGEDRVIAGPGGDLRLRIYGRDRLTRKPGIVFFHGGGFVSGSLDTHDALCREISSDVGAVLVSVDYRLAPEHKFPAAVEDAWTALCHVARHADVFGIDPARLAVAGDSAGGNLAAVSAIRARDSGHPSLCQQLLIYPVLDLRLNTDSYRRFSTGYLLTRDMMQWFVNLYVGEADDIADPEASPLCAASLRGVAPAIVVTAAFDPLGDEGVAFADRLEQDGVAVQKQMIEGGFHGFVSFAPILPEAAAALSRVTAALKAALA